MILYVIQQLSEDTNLRSSVCEAINNTIERNLTQDSSGDWWKVKRFTACTGICHWFFCFLDSRGMFVDSWLHYN